VRRCYHFKVNLIDYFQVSNSGSLSLQLLQKAFLQVNTDLNALAQVLAWFDQFNSPPVPDGTWMRCQLALVEGYTNAVRHAHQNKPVDTPIEMEVKIYEDSLEIRIWDCGPPFDLHKKLQAMPQKLDTEAEGGRGLRLMQRIADRLSYERLADGRNCLTIIKQY